MVSALKTKGQQLTAPANGPGASEDQGQGVRPMPCSGGGETGSISARTSDRRGNLNNAKQQTLRPKPFTPETLGWVPGVAVS